MPHATIQVLLQILPFALAAASLLGNLVLFLLLKAELHRHKSQSKASLRQAESRTGSIEAQLQQWRSEINLLAQPASTVTYSPRPSLNINRRHQVLRLRRRGDRPEQIAAALGVPLNEVELLLKLHQALAPESV
jgi:hypothetical protein